METDLDARIRSAILRLLDRRRAGASICPSDAAREVEPHAWRALMPRVRAVAAALAACGVIEIRQRGLVVDPSHLPRGPVRLARPPDGSADGDAS